MPSSDLEALIAACIEVEKGNSKGGNKGFTCLHCKVRYFGSRSRQLAHLLCIKGKGVAPCAKIPLEDKETLLEAYRGTPDAPENEPCSGSRPVSDTGMNTVDSLDCAVLNSCGRHLLQRYASAGSVEDPPKEEVQAAGPATPAAECIKG